MKTNATKSHIHFKKDDVACKMWMLCCQALGKGLQHCKNEGTVEREPDWLRVLCPENPQCV